METTEKFDITIAWDDTSPEMGTYSAVVSAPNDDEAELFVRVRMRRLGKGSWPFGSRVAKTEALKWGGISFPAGAAPDWRRFSRLEIDACAGAGGDPNAIISGVSDDEAQLYIIFGRSWDGSDDAAIHECSSFAEADHVIRKLVDIASLPGMRAGARRYQYWPSKVEQSVINFAHSLSDEPLYNANTSIDELAIGVREYNGLVNAPIKTVGELATLDVGELLRVPNIGQKSIVRIHCAMKKLGVRWPSAEKYEASSVWYRRVRQEMGT